MLMVLVMLSLLLLFLHALLLCFLSFLILASPALSTLPAVNQIRY